MENAIFSRTISAVLLASGLAVASSNALATPITATETIFDFDLTTLVPGPSYTNIGFSAVFASGDPVVGSDVLITNIYGGLAGTDLIQVANHTAFLTGGGTIYGPFITANPIFNPMLDGVFSFGLRMTSGTAELVSFTACGNPFTQGPCQTVSEASTSVPEPASYALFLLGAAALLASRSRPKQRQ